MANSCKIIGKLPQNKNYLQIIIWQKWGRKMPEFTQMINI